MDPHDRDTALVRGLLEPAAYGHPTGTIRLVETHISWVFLTGPFAYKVKKPVRLSFLDFSTVERRRHFCEEELRLNRRLAPDVYLDVVPIAGTPEAPAVGGPGPAFEHAVRMRQFSSAGLLPLVLARGELARAHIDEIARAIAEFHARIDVAAPTSPYGGPLEVRRAMLETARELIVSLPDGEPRRAARSLESWTIAACHRLRDAFEERRRSGRVRECHGDLHLGNMALEENGRLVLFDGIEFDPALRWIDVASEIAFPIMDLELRGRADLGSRLLDRYLEITGDHDALRVLPIYEIYRFLVRAKVDAIRARQTAPGSAEEAEDLELAARHVRRALDKTAPRRPAVLATHGLSGSGKSSLAAELVEALPAVRVRSDVERKRLHGLPADRPVPPELRAEVYSPESTERAYERLEEIAAIAIDAGFDVILDATYLTRRHRQRLAALARRRQAPFVILHLDAPLEMLAARAAARARAGGDASDADAGIVAGQAARLEPLGPDEIAAACRIDAVAPPDVDTLVAVIRRRCGRAPRP